MCTCSNYTDLLIVCHFLFWKMIKLLQADIFKLQLYHLLLQFLELTPEITSCNWLEKKKSSFYYFILILVPRKFWSIFDEEEDNLWLNGAILELLQVTIMDKRTFQYVRLEQQSSNFYLHCETLLQLLFKSSFVGSVLWVKSMQLVKKSQLYYLPFKFSCILLKFCIGMSSGWDDEVSWGKVLFSVVQEKIILLILYLWHILLEYEWWLI